MGYWLWKTIYIATPSISPELASSAVARDQRKMQRWRQLVQDVRTVWKFFEGGNLVYLVLRSSFVCMKATASLKADKSLQNDRESGWIVVFWSVRRGTATTAAHRECQSCWGRGCKGWGVQECRSTYIFIYTYTYIITCTCIYYEVLATKRTCIVMSLHFVATVHLVV